MYWLLDIGYLEEEVAVDEPAGVAEANELHDLGQLLNRVPHHTMAGLAQKIQRAARTNT